MLPEEEVLFTITSKQIYIFFDLWNYSARKDYYSELRNLYIRNLDERTQQSSERQLIKLRNLAYRFPLRSCEMCNCRFGNIKQCIGCYCAFCEGCFDNITSCMCGVWGDITKKAYVCTCCRDTGNNIFYDEENICKKLPSAFRFIDQNT